MVLTQWLLLGRGASNGIQTLTELTLHYCWCFRNPIPNQNGYIYMKPCNYMGSKQPQQGAGFLFPSTGADMFSPSQDIDTCCCVVYFIIDLQLPPFTGMGGITRNGRYGYVYFHSTSSNWSSPPRIMAENKGLHKTKQFLIEASVFFATFVANWTIYIYTYIYIYKFHQICCLLFHRPEFWWILWGFFSLSNFYFPSMLGGNKTPSKSNKSHDLDLWTPTQQLKMKVLYLGFACFNAEKKKVPTLSLTLGRITFYFSLHLAFFWEEFPTGGLKGGRYE